MEIVRKIIKELRIEAKLTQTQLANKMGVSRQAISHWEIGDREPSIEMIKKLVKLFDVSADYILGLED